jgi:hypothetical protein
MKFTALTAIILASALVVTAAPAPNSAAEMPEAPPAVGGYTPPQETGNLPDNEEKKPDCPEDEVLPVAEEPPYVAPTDSQVIADNAEAPTGYAPPLPAPETEVIADNVEAPTGYAPPPPAPETEVIADNDEIKDYGSNQESENLAADNTKYKCANPEAAVEEPEETTSEAVDFGGDAGADTDFTAPDIDVPAQQQSGAMAMNLIGAVSVLAFLFL